MSNNQTREAIDNAVVMIRQGRATAEIATKTGLSERSIATIRANDTMGKYASQELEAVAELEKVTFGLERDLQEALRENIGQLEPGLKIIDDGKEQIVASGKIDISAKDKRGATVVIELKAGEADREAVAQLLSYMGDIVSDGGKPVRGILLAAKFSARAISAARASANIELKRYSFNFSFQAVNTAKNIS